MYSRNRLPPSEERYRSSIPPVYSGSRFQPVRRERETAEEPSSAPEAPGSPDIPVSTDIPAVPESAVSAGTSSSGDAFSAQECPEPPAAEQEPRHVGSFADLLGGIGQEEMLLIALLLLLSAEHDRAMDIIVILLILLSIR